VSASPHQGDDTAARIGERLVSLRADRGLRVAELARRAGMSPSLVSQIERPGEDRFVVRRGRRATIEIEGGVRWERLTPATLEGADVIELVYAPGAESHSQGYRHPEGVELVLVLRGTLVVEVDGVPYELHEGDSMQFPSSAEHRYVNPTDEEARGVGARVYTGRPA
jgi:quercetin dioxygenase-like cupin family protein